jgi:hypothetical protein
MVCGCSDAATGRRNLRRADMAKLQRAVVLLAGLALIGGCTSPGWNKVGGTQAREPVVLKLANFMGDALISGIGRF